MGILKQLDTVNSIASYFGATEDEALATQLEGKAALEKAGHIVMSMPAAAKVRDNLWSAQIIYKKRKDT